MKVDDVSQSELRNPGRFRHLEGPLFPWRMPHRMDSVPFYLLFILSSVWKLLALIVEAIVVVACRGAGNTLLALNIDDQEHPIASFLPQRELRVSSLAWVPLFCPLGPTPFTN